MCVALLDGVRFPTALALIAAACAVVAALGTSAWLRLRAPAPVAGMVAAERITTMACVERRPGSGRLAFRVTDTIDSTLPGRTARAASADASGGQSAAAPVVPSRRDVQSTTVDGVWLGSRIYLVAADHADAVERYLGRPVVVTGMLEPYPIEGTGAVATVQSARGVEFRTLRPLRVRPVAGVCGPTNDR